VREGQVEREVVVLAECYANRCVAEEIIEMLREVTEASKSIRHTAKMGRDEVLKRYKKILSNPSTSNAYVLAVIDYEQGKTREYIDKNFDLRAPLYNNTVHIGIDKKSPRGVVVVFDPFIEEFLCKVSDRFCRDEERKSIKHGDIDCKKLINESVAKALKTIAKELHNIFTKG
jgi:hypothetical protein